MAGRLTLYSTVAVAAAVLAAAASLTRAAAPARTQAQGRPQAGAARAGGPPAAPAAAPKLVFAFEMHAQVDAPAELGAMPAGRRRIVPITGGSFEGPGGFRGRVLPGGADWQIVRADGFTELDTRYTIETDTKKLVYVQNAGMRHAAPDVIKRLLAGEAVDPALVYFRTVPRFETSAPELQWLTRAVFIGIGERYPAEVVIRFYRLE